MYLHVTEDMRVRECPQYKKGFCRLGKHPLATATPLSRPAQPTDRALRNRPRMSAQARPPRCMSRLPRRLLRQRTHLRARAPEL